jgi:hypothetical protein
MKLFGITLLIIFFLPSLASAIKHSNSEVTFYVYNFSYMYHRDVSEINVQLVDQLSVNSPGAVGYCFHATDTVEILKEYWELLDPLRKQMIIFHELGHCAMGRAHSDELYDDNCPKSIMHHQMAIKKCYIKHYDEMIQELSHITRNTETLFLNK